MHIQEENNFTINTIGRSVIYIEAIWNDGQGNLDCHLKIRVYWIGTEILPCCRMMKYKCHKNICSEFKPKHLTICKSRIYKYQNMSGDVIMIK